jgi:hypothetical protein
VKSNGFSLKGERRMITGLFSVTVKGGKDQEFQDLILRGLGILFVLKKGDYHG